MNFGLLESFRNSDRNELAFPELYRRHVDVLSGGRLDLGLGQGYRPQEFAGFNIARTERAWDDAEYAIHYLMARYGQWIAEAADAPGDQRFAKAPSIGALRKLNDTRFLGEPLIIGSPDDAIEMLERYTDYTHLALGMSLPGLDPKKVRASMRLFAREVIPHFRRKSRAAAAKPRAARAGRALAAAIARPRARG